MSFSINATREILNDRFESRSLSAILNAHHQCLALNNGIYIISKLLSGCHMGVCLYNMHTNIICTLA